MNAPRLLTKEVRQGFSYAFPYDEVSNVVYKGLMKRSGPIADTVRGYDPDVFLYQTDLDKAKELILAGGFKEGDVFEYMVDANEETEQTVAQLFQANVQAMGFNLELDLGRLRHDRVDRLWRRPTRRAAALHRRLGLVARLQRPVEPALAELHRGQHRRRRIKRGRMGQSRASRRSWPRQSTSRARSNSTN